MNNNGVCFEKTTDQLPNIFIPAKVKGTDMFNEGAEVRLR